MIAFNPADHPAWMAGWQASAASLPREAIGWQTDRAKELFLSGYDAERRNAA